MKIVFRNFPKNSLHFFRQLGYHPDKFQKPDTLSFSRRLGGNPYPKFHIFLRSPQQSQAILSLHLDVKKPSYKGGPAHSAEYEGKIVEAEMKRIKNSLRDCGYLR